METLAQDLRFALRSLARQPTLVAVAVLALALGIGATSALFSVVNGVLLEPLPYDQPEQLVRVFDRSSEQPRFPMAPANFVDHREALGDGGELAVYMRDDVELTAGERSERLHGMVVSAGFFRLLRHPPLFGRGFELADERPEAPDIVVLSHRFWLRHLEGDPGAVGRQILLDGLAHTVVGVLPPGLEHVGGSYRSLPHGSIVDVWRPIELDRERRNWHFLNGLARLAPGLTPETAAARMNVTAERLAEQYPETNGAWRIAVVPLAEEIVGASRPRIRVLMGAGVLVLLIALVNVANLLLVRATTRRHEIGVRRALGAGTSRLLRQLMTENLLLAGVGGVLGLALAHLGVRVLRLWGPEAWPRLHAVEVDPRVTAFTVAVTILAGLASGAVPALRMTRTSLREALLSSGRALTGGTSRLRQVLVVGQLVLAIVLLIGAGLLVESFRQMHLEDPGFDAEGVLTASIALPKARYGEASEVTHFYRRLRHRLEALPGVVAAGAGSNLPWSGHDENMRVGPADLGDDPERSMYRTRFHHVTPGYFRSLGVPILSGRELEDGDDAGAPRRVVISRRMADLLWPEEDAVGRRLSWSTEPTENNIFTVVGVVADIKDGPGGAQLVQSTYFAHAQLPWNSNLVLAIRTRIDPISVVPTVRRELRAIDPDLPLAEVRTLEQVADGSYATPRFLSALVAGFAGVALVLAMIGLYGVISYAARQRRRELALRAALGARASQIIALVIRQGLWLVTAGAVLGVAGALGLVGFLRSLLYGVEATEPWIFLTIVPILVTVALAASWIPARRAGRVHPAEVLRQD